MKNGFRWGVTFWLLMTIAIVMHGWWGLLFTPLAFIVGLLVMVAYEDEHETR